MRSASVQHVLKAFETLLKIHPNDCSKVGVEIPIPVFSENVLLDLCHEATNVFMRSDIVLKLEGSFYIAGDIHGNIFDLIRVICHAGPPPESKLLFLGDYVDRGEYSVEVVALLFALACQYPQNVFLLRGNHEFDGINATYGFHAESTSIFHSEEVYNAVNDAFNHMPLVAIVNKKLFAVHGGICPEFTSLDQLTRLRRPIKSYDTTLLADLVWSDPSVDSKGVDKSNRGLGVTFGVKPLKDFLAHFGCDAMVRGHQCVTAGIQRFGDGCLYTVFSCSNYVDYTGNRCGLIFYGEDCKIAAFSLPPLQQVSRATSMKAAADGFSAKLETTAQNSLALNLPVGRRATFSGMRPPVPVLVRDSLIRSPSSLIKRRILPDLRRPSTADVPEKPQ